MKKVIAFICLTLCLFVAVGCSQTESTSSTPDSAPPVSTAETQSESTPKSTPETTSATNLTVTFGDRGENFTLHLYGNDTAAAIARHVGTADWRLPIYHYDDFENWEVMQYYDIPSRYEIPSSPETVTSEKAGEVYYSEPNRIVLFYGDAEVSGEYTPVGCFEATEEFVRAVEENPVLEGWGNKIVRIAPGSDEREVSQTSVITTEEQEESNMINLQIGEQTLTAELADNSSAQAFAELLREGPVTVQMSDYGNFEKVGPLPTSLPENNEQITTEPGDIILYQGNSITVYYDVNTWNFTRLGKVQAVSGEELRGILGEGEVEITFSLNNL